MLIQFIAHAGIAVIEDGHTLLCDPWFQDSNLQSPLVEGLSGAKTIDFQLPKTKTKISSYKPDAILVSHFHPHHSPAKDISQLIGQSKQVTLAYPALTSDAMLRERFSAQPHVTLKSSTHGGTFRVGPFLIRAWEHTTEGHLAWSIESKTGHVLHISDARFNKSFEHNVIDSAWNEFKDQDFDMVFLTAGKNDFVIKNDSSTSILENCILSPVQAAKLTRLLHPRGVALIGIYNHSIWTNWIEYRTRAADCEEEFSWALDWLAPHVEFISIRPGHTFGIGDKELLGKVKTYLV